MKRFMMRVVNGTQVVFETLPAMGHQESVRRTET
jgi:hypothetical protein